MNITSHQNTKSYSMNITSKTKHNSMKSYFANRRPIHKLCQIILYYTNIYFTNRNSLPNYVFEHIAFIITYFYYTISNKT